VSLDVFKYLASEIDKVREVIEEQLALGHCKEFGDYKFACGRYRGLLEAKDLIIETAKRYQNDED
jgi:hypothetical protein